MHGIRSPPRDSSVLSAGILRRPDRRDQFSIAIVCALPLEYDAVTLLVDEFWDDTGDTYGRSVGDSNSYTTGRIGNHHVVVALLPGIGKVNAAVAVAGLRASYTNIKLTLLTGICGGVPISGTRDEILLGDVIVSDSLVQYDHGRLYPGVFATRVGDGHNRSNADVRGLLATLRTELGLERLQRRTSYFLLQLQQESLRKSRRDYQYPGAASDKLFAPDHRHRHYGPCFCTCSQWKQLSDPVCQEVLSISCSETGCEIANVVSRRRLELRYALQQQNSRVSVQDPLVFIGRIGSGDTVMKSGVDRDRIAKEHDIIAFEMEGAGLWEELPCLVVKGVCDYADSHKDKAWQDFAAATAAATMKALLEKYIHSDRRVPDSIGGSVSTESIQRWTTLSPEIYQIIAVADDNRWRDCVVRAAMAHLPTKVRDAFAAVLNSEVTSKDLKSRLSTLIEATPSTPTWLCHTAPYERFVSEVENTICYEAIDKDVGVTINLREESEDIPLCLLGDLEKWEAKRRAEELAQARSLDRTLRDLPVLPLPEEMPSIPMAAADFSSSLLGFPEQLSFANSSVSAVERVYLFYSPRDEHTSQIEAGLSPLQSFLWCMVSQALLWETTSMHSFLSSSGVVDMQSSGPLAIPEVPKLKKFLLSLIRTNSRPVVISICRADKLSREMGNEPFEFLASLCDSTASLGVRVFLILSTLDQISMLPGIKKSQTLNRYTERDECLEDFRFEEQNLRRDEVDIADEGTNDWIWFHPSFTTWQHKPSGLLWIQGKAGSGKSVLAKTIRTKLSEARRSARRGLPLPQIGDWFYSTRHGTSTRSHLHFLRSILSQFLEQNRHVFPMYASVYREKKNQSKSWDFGDYEAILFELANHGTNTVCIVDAMDESEDDQGTFALRRKVIYLMARLASNPGSQIKFIVTSRYTADIDSVLHHLWKQGDELSHIVLERENSQDIALLVDNGLAALKEAMNAFESDIYDVAGVADVPNYLSPKIGNAEEDDDQIFRRMRQFLLEHTQGVILWIKLTMQVLIERVRGALYSTQELEKDLRSLPNDLSDFYKLILRDLQARYPEGLEKTRLALMWIVGATAIRPLALDELYEAISIPIELDQNLFSYKTNPMIYGPLHIRARSWTGFYRQLRVRCGPLVEVIVPLNHRQEINLQVNMEINPRFTIQLLHRTVKDFLQNAEASGPLYFSEREADILVQGSLERYVTLVLPTQPTMYCPTPAKQSSGFEDTGVSKAMAVYLNRKNLLEFALSVLPEERWLEHLEIFERSVHPPLTEQRGSLEWSRRLYEICHSYFTYSCDEGLTTAIANLLTMSTILTMSWPTSLRYGPLATAIKKCTLPWATIENILNDPSKCEAISMVRAFSSAQDSLIWECEGLQDASSPRITVPDGRALSDSIAKFAASHRQTTRNATRDETNLDI